MIEAGQTCFRYPPFLGAERPAAILHLRRQIGGDFHAGADFNDDRGMPAHSVLPLI